MTRKKASTKRAAVNRSRGKRVDSFLDEMATKPVRGLCTACRHPKRKAIEADCRRFAARRAAGETGIPFRTFVIRWITPQYGLTVQGDGIRGHMENCLGVKVT